MAAADTVAQGRELVVVVVVAARSVGDPAVWTQERGKRADNLPEGENILGCNRVTADLENQMLPEYVPPR